MQVPFMPLLIIAAVIAVMIALAHDVAMIAAQALAPWFGWMFP